MTELENRLGYAFKNRALLELALTHSSYANEHRGEGGCNERLEYLGDSVLGFVVADHLYRTRPDLAEGKMTRLRAEMVCEGSLAAVAGRLGLGDRLLLGRGEEQGGGRKRASILADAMEALLAAVYLDSGFEEASGLIHALVIGPFEAESHSDADYKTRLQELVQRKAGDVLTYREIGETGPDHMKEFTVAACLNDRELARGVGRSKKLAEQAAARAALEVLK